MSSNAQTFTNIAVINDIEAISWTTDGGGAGISSYDYNLDGWDDLSFVYEDGEQKIYLNNQGDFELAPISFFSVGENKQILWVDYDNDYDLDIFLTRKNGINLLLNNNGNFDFTDVTLSSGLSVEISTNLGASFADYDLDGDLDLYVCKYLGVGDSMNITHLNNLYRNNGNGTFSDATLISGLVNEVSPSFQGLWLDYNHDLFPDLYVINDRVPWANIFYQNNGDGTFTNIASLNQTEMNGSDAMSISLGDYDNDGDQDFFVSDAGSPNAPKGSLFSQTPSLDYIDEANNLGIGIETTMWGSTWLDYNNDGFLDLYIANEGLPGPKNFFYVNDSTDSFNLDTSIFVGDYGVTSFGVASADFNRDGFQDIVAVNLDSTNNFLWLNSGGSNNYIRITLQGTVSNSFAIGTTIKVFAMNQIYTKYTVCGENYLGQNSQHHIFGLGNASQVDSVHVEYLSGITDRYYNLSANQEYYLTEGETFNNFSILVDGETQICPGDSVELLAPIALSYLWNTGATTQAIWVDSSGSYGVEILDTNGLNLISSELLITQVGPANVSLQVSVESCDQSADGSIVLSVTNDGQDYSTLWQDGSQGDSLLNIGAGNYTYLYTDEFGCQQLDSVILAGVPPLNVQLEVTPQTDSLLGAIEVLINGGTPPYTLVINSDTVNIQLDSLASGMYYLTILDNNLCSILDSVFIPLQIDIAINTAINSFANNEFKAWFDYPNRGLIVQVSTVMPKDFQVKIFTLLGEEVAFEAHFVESQKHTYVMKLDHFLESGFYFFKIGNDAQNKTLPVLFH
ncbi:MAG: CRTAC1 family protein [Chitinophagales bacterium]